MKFDIKPMVDWYDPKQLAATGVKTVVSTVFGNFADRREMQAALIPSQPYHDCSKEDELWMDYICDLGDGFNPTYTLAHLLAKAELVVGEKVTKRGNILVMGGDEVYPTPEMKEYDNRLRGPYHAAFPKDKDDKNPPKLFVIPGNHDWYDGLTNFLKVFCQGRSLGNWRTEQTRSYFAIKLPHRYWLLGIDIQLNSDIDVPQLGYFRNVAENHFQPGDKVILATAEPAWVYESFDIKNNSNRRLNFFINKILIGKPNEDEEETSQHYYGGKNKDIQIQIVLTGDLHHYSRYVQPIHGQQDRQLITAGGGGAFLHTTHSLVSDPEKLSEAKIRFEKAFPSKTESLKLNLQNLLFVWHGWRMSVILGCVNLLIMMLLFLGKSYSIDKGFYQSIEELDFSQDWIEPILFSPFALILWITVVIGIFLFADTKSGGHKYLNRVAGLVHGLLQGSVIFLFLISIGYLGISISILRGLLGCLVAIVLGFVAIGVSNSMVKYLTLLGFLVVGCIPFLLSGLFFGFYLWFCSQFLGNHITEASSAFKGEHFKNIVRIQITKEGIAIYPLGIRKVIKNWKNVGTDESPEFKGDEPKVELIEKPIFIPNT